MSNKTNPITFAKAKQMNEEGTSAIVLRGAGSEEYRDNWINGINNELIEDGIFESPMTEVYLLPTIHDERIDIVMVFTPEHGVNIGRMAMWRLTRQQDVSWLEDYVVNDKDVH